MAEHLVLKPNEVYSRPQIHSLIGGQQLGPISTPSAFRLILLFLETEKDTRLHSAGVWNFNGEANDEGTTLSRNNRMVVEHNSKGKYLLVFVLKPNQTHEREYLFIGVAVYRSHTIERGVVVFSMQMLEDLTESERRKFLLGESDQDQSGGAVVLLPDGGVSITLYKTKYFKVSREDFGIPKVDKKTKKKTTIKNEPTVSKEELETCFEKLGDAQNQPNNAIPFQQKSPTSETTNIISIPSNETDHNMEEIKVDPFEEEKKSENADKQSEKKRQEKREDKEKKKKKRRKIVLEGDKGEEIQASSLSTLGSPFIQIVNGEIVFPTIPTPSPTTPHQKEKSIPRGARCLGKSNKFVGQSGRFIYDPEKDKKKLKGGGKEKEQTTQNTERERGKKKVGDKTR